LIHLGFCASLARRSLGITCMKRRTRHPKVNDWVVALRRIADEESDGQAISHCSAGEIGRVIYREFADIGRPALAVRWPSGTVSCSIAGDDVARLTAEDVPRLARVRIMLAELEASNVIDLRLLHVLRDMERNELAISTAAQQ
jgi:hypothetical protein